MKPPKTKRVDDVVILETTEDQKFARFDSMSAPELQDVYCPRCKYIVERTKIMLQTGKLDKNFAKGMCIHCRQKSQPQIPCYECEEITQKFISRLWEQSDNSKQKLRTWLAKVKHLLKDVREHDESADKEKHGLRRSELHPTRVNGTTDTLQSEKKPKIMISSKQKSYIAEDDKILKSTQDTKSIYRTRSFDSYLQHLSNISGVKVVTAKFHKKYGSKTDRSMASGTRDYDSDYARDAQYVLKPSRTESAGRRDHDSYYLPDNMYGARTDRVPSPGRLMQHPSDKPDNIISPGLRNYDVEFPSDKKSKLKPDRTVPHMMDDYDVQYTSSKKHILKPDRITSSGSQDYESNYSQPDKKHVAKSDRSTLRDRQKYDSDYILNKKYQSEPESRAARNIREYEFNYQDHKKTSKKGTVSPFESLDKLIHEEYLKQSMPEIKKYEKKLAKEHPQRLRKSVALDDVLLSKSPMHRSRSETTILDAGKISGPGVLKSVTDVYKERKLKTTDKKIKDIDTISSYRSPLKKFPSEELLSTLVSGSEPLLRKDFSYQFPKEIVVKKEPKRQRTSAELIMETQDMLNTREEEKRHRLEIERVKKRHDAEMKREAREEKKRLQEENRREQEELKRIAEREKQLAEEEKRRLEEERKREVELTQEDKNMREKDKLRVKGDIKTKDEEKLSAKDLQKEKDYDGRIKEIQDIQNKERAKEEKEKAKEDKERAKEEKERAKAEKEREKAEKLKERAEREKEKSERKKDEETKRRVKEEAKEKPEKVDKEKEKEGKEADKLKIQKEKEIQARIEKEEKLREKEEKDRLKKEREDLLRTEKEQKQKEKEDGQKKKQSARDQEKAIKDEKTEPKDRKKQRDKIDKKEKHTKDAVKPEVEEETPFRELELKQVKIRKPSYDDLIVRLVRLKQAEPREKKEHHEKIFLENLPVVAHEHLKTSRHNKELDCLMCHDSNVELDVESILMKTDQVEPTFTDIIIGQKIFKYKPYLADKEEKGAVIPVLFQSNFNAMSPNVDNIHSEPVSPIQTASRQPIVAPPKSQKQVEEAPKGVIRYALSDRAFIDKGWTMLPTEKVMNVYRMRPAHPEFDWFERNKKKKLMLYDTGEKLAEFDDNGRSRIYYKNGRLALDYYDAEEVNAHQRFVVFSSGELDERGRSHPITILATFDYLGNGIVFDNGGKIRLKYNQTEGVILDRNIGPVSNWKWHTLNDPPVLQKVMIDTQMAHKDPDIYKMGGPADDKSRPDNEEMLAIEFDNFIKEKSKKLTQSFKPFQIKMKALKINENFSLKILDQATIYLIFRDSTANVKLNLGMILDHKEIVDTDTAEVGEVSNSLERFPARTESLAGLQRSVAYAQRFERARIERERRLRPPEPCTSADQLTAAASRPLRPPLRTLPSASTTVVNLCKCSRKPCSSNIYYDTRPI